MKSIIGRVKRVGLLPRIIVAIVLGIGLGHVLPLWAVRAMETFNDLFGNLLGFLIPLIIVGLVTPALGNIGGNAGRMLIATVLIAYGDTLLAGFFSYGVSTAVFPHLIEPGSAAAIGEQMTSVDPYFSIKIPPLFDVMSALALAFVAGLGITYTHATTLRRCADEAGALVSMVIRSIIVPLLPVYIMGLFMVMAHTGQVWDIMRSFGWVIVVIFALHIVLLLLQYLIAGAIARRNGLRLLAGMLPAYFTALGTSSSAATIPVTLDRVKANGVDARIAGFVVPLCATIHLSGSTLKITSCAVSLLLMQGLPVDPMAFAGFIAMLGVMMIAAPGVPGGAIMAALGVLSTVLGFDTAQQGLMIALYIAMDSFGTACNVTGDGAIAVVIQRLFGKDGATSTPA